MAGPRVYIHEFVDIVGHKRASYMHHVTANWGPIGRSERAQSCFGVWAVVGSTGRWPQVVNLWEYENWEALGRNFEIETQGAGLQDPSLEAWWAAAAEFRSGGVDRILVAPEWSPSIGDHCNPTLGKERGVAVGYVHELVRCRPGAGPEFLDRVRESEIEHHRRAGLSLVGAFGRAMVDDDECVLIWSFDSWNAWADFEADRSGSSAQRRERRRDLVTGTERILLADAPLSPLRTRRQPSESDRFDLS